MIEGIVFDLDGTLTRPRAIDFDRIRARIGMPRRGSILHWIEAEIPDAAERARCLVVVEEEEALGLERMALNEGFEELADLLGATRGHLRTAISTRNSRAALEAFDALLAREGHGGVERLFCCWHARDHRSPHLGRALRNKPHPEPAHEAVRAWGLAERFPAVDLGARATEPAHPALLFVGDSWDDVLAGRRAGFATCLVTNGVDPDSAPEGAGAAGPPPTLTVPDLSHVARHVVALRR